MPILTGGDIMLELKIAYNKLIERFNKAEEYMESETVKVTDKKKWLAQFVDLIWDLNDTLNQIRDSGHTITKLEIQNGFEITDEKQAV
jgi:flagellin-specific chaperone FliS